VLHKTL